MCRPKLTLNPSALFTKDDFEVMSTSERYDIEYDLKNSAYKIITANKHYWGFAKCLNFVSDLNYGYYALIKDELEGFNDTQSKELLIAYLNVLSTIQCVERGEE